ncbi:protein-glutamate O-methyltransferase CheR [Rossellomorea vietnamensis]|uniref:Protein-glutamate O-methyltransferase CheR n=1 Tax=Rossellomorea vietnamensis TaxID=218284 RepID=A0ACD4C8S9_9BACI|nr:protein-glutamate O-methyltransferase CheR [Rossellomorea vietnamensis]UXH44644.1 protein-glutamate O-methyltransferase CheR [Rossellomorea vietnamensis]WQI95985.1 protein-glutamate O-methyltransferase CheR [Rossellomorea vietnamensis]
MSNDYSEFIQGVKRKTGIDLSLYKEAQMKRRLTALYEKKGYGSFQEFFGALNRDREEMEGFLDRMTINVSEFFRNYKRWEILETKILPRLLSENPSLRVWSAACSTGEEPYTLSMMLSKYMALSNGSITATDIDKNALQRAMNGVYPERSLSELPEEMKKVHFTQEGPLFKLKDEVKRTVNFKQQNLLSDPFEGKYDLIVCRNVMIYFTEEAKNLLYHKFNHSLKPGGVLFVGSTEQIFNPSQYGFETEDTFFYKKI